MKNIKKLLILGSIFLSMPVFAAETVVTRILKDTTTMVALNLNDKTVFCTPRGYGINSLKISVPELDWLAHFDHRVVGETLPCITAGACTDALQPGNIIDLNQPLAVVPIRVVLTEFLYMDAEKKTCNRLLSEHITSYIRDHRFNHFMSGELLPVQYEICEKTAFL